MTLFSFSPLAHSRSTKRVAVPRAWCQLGQVSLLALALFGGTAWAELADRDQPMNAEANEMRYDEAKKTHTMIGRVVITKGSILIRGQEVVVRQDGDGNQFGLVRSGPQQPAFFRQKREGLNEFIEGTAKQIDYDSKADTVRFTGQAVLKRFKGTVLNDEVVGGVIVFNNTRQSFDVQSGDNARSPDNPSGRVRALITPTPKGPAPVSSSPASGDAKPLQSVPQLKDPR